MFTVVWKYPIDAAYRISRRGLFQRFGLRLTPIPNSSAMLISNAFSNSDVVIEEDIYETAAHPDQTPLNGRAIPTRRGRIPLPKTTYRYVGVREVHLPISVTRVLLPGSSIDLDGGEVRTLFQLKHPKVPWANGRRSGQPTRSHQRTTDP